MEVNFDSIIGLTHNFGGLSYGNTASTNSRHDIAHPKDAALQGLYKMKALADLGIPQAVLPPHERPAIWQLRKIGFSGTDANILETVSKNHPELLAINSSASAMWAANAATVSPSADTIDGKVHFTPANLVSNHHRSIEAETTTTILRTLFSDKKHFIVHDPLPPNNGFSDEGAANHSRLHNTDTSPGIELFVYGSSFLDTRKQKPKVFPARHTLEASQAIARCHSLDEERVVFAQQHPDAIDAGCFHNDVISVCHKNMILYHEHAFVDTSAIITTLDELFDMVSDTPLCPIMIPANMLSYEQAVTSYLFNSQLITTPEGKNLLVVPIESQEQDAARLCLEHLVSSSNPIDGIVPIDIRQSMKNGGGPACLRLRVVLTDEQRAAIKGRVFLDDTLYDVLCEWVNAHYRDSLASEELGDPSLLNECHTALDSLTQLLQLGSIYNFQK